MAGMAPPCMTCVTDDVLPSCAIFRHYAHINASSPPRVCGPRRAMKAAGWWIGNTWRVKTWVRTELGEAFQGPTARDFQRVPMLDGLRHIPASPFITSPHLAASPLITSPVMIASHPLRLRISSVPHGVDRGERWWSRADGLETRGGQQSGGARLSIAQLPRTVCGRGCRCCGCCGCPGLSATEPQRVPILRVPGTVSGQRVPGTDGCLMDFNASLPHLPSHHHPVHGSSSQTPVAFLLGARDWRLPLQDGLQYIPALRAVR